MIRHYLKIAFRNLKKYRLQSVISIIGMAIGFACFALSTLWIRYELTYDTFHKDAGQIYLVRHESKMDDSGISSITPYPLAGYLKNTYPEIEDACNTQAHSSRLNYKGADFQSFQMSVDSASMKMFDIRVLAGEPSFMIEKSDNIAISDKLAQKLFGSKDPLGEEIEIYGTKMKICAIVQGWSKHSNMPFEILDANNSAPEWNFSSWQTYIKVKKGTDIKELKKKLHDSKIKSGDYELPPIILTPLTTMHYENPMIKATVQFEHILLFAVAGGLVILCALFNYLTLFVNRIRIRGKEIGLRKVCGSSNTGLLSLFSAEYLLTLLFAFLCGMIFIELSLPYFKEISGVTTNTFGIYIETFIYFLLVILLSFAFSCLLIHSFSKQSVNAVIKGGQTRNSKNIFLKISLTVQLIISIGFIFCSSVLIKQIHYLRTTNVGFERANHATFTSYPSIDGFKDELSKLPFVTEILPDYFNMLYPQYGKSMYTLNEWDEKPESVENISFEIFRFNQSFFHFYGFQLLKGELPEDKSTDHILINETAAKEMKVDNPVGKTIKWKGRPFVIAGIVKNFHIVGPTVPVKPALLDFSEEETGGGIHFKYQGEWEKCKKQIEQLMNKMNPNIHFSYIFSTEKEYEKLWESESILLRMLDFVTVICILISLFGVFSQVTLDCEQHRKEIAIRKINGASIPVIARSFFRKYLLSLCIASCIIFPIGYTVMKSWIENYVLQTTISWWLYPVIWLAVAFLLVLCTGWRIWRAANQNPSEVIKSE